MADETNPYDFGFTGSPGGLYVLPGEGYGVRAETGLTVPDDNSAVDPISGNPVDTQPGMPNWSITGDQTKSWLDTVKNIFGGTSDAGALGQLAAFGGLAALLNKFAGQQSQQPVGYQGGIPKYTASRTQYDTGFSTDTARLKQAVNDSLAQGFTMDQIRQGALQKFGISPSQISEAMASPAGAYRRPGQGGITYFSPVEYRTGTSSGIETLPGGQTGAGDIERRTAQGVRRTAATPSAITSSAVPAAGTPERAAYEQRLASQMTPAEFEALKANPFSVLSPSFNAQVQANLAGQEELRRLGMSSQFGTNLSDTATPQDIQKYFTALQIERPLGGQITENRDLNTLMTRYLDSLESGDVGSAFSARNRMLSLGVNPQNLDKAKEILRPGINDKAYYQYYDPSNPQAKGLPVDIAGKGSDFSWPFIASQKEKYGLTNDQIAFALGMSPEEVKRALPPGAAAGGYMPGGIAMLAGGRYLRGPGDGVSDSIPAKFERSGQPARLADGEFVIDARTVSEIGNGSSEAGARKLYAMMDRVHKARKTAKRGKPSGADKFLPK